MSTRPTNHNGPAENKTPDQEPPLRALAIGILPADLPSHLMPCWGLNAASGGYELEDIGYGPERALAIGPSGPAIRPLSKAELAAQASAINFNPSHNELGRFTTSSDAGGRDDGPDGKGGGETKPASIARYQ